MKTNLSRFDRFYLGVIVSLPCLLTGCATVTSEVTYRPDSAQESMTTASEAQRLLKQSLEASPGDKTISVNEDVAKIAFATPANVSMHGYKMPYDGKEVYIRFQALASADCDCAVTKMGTPIIGYTYHVNGVGIWWEQPSDANNCARALAVLIHKAKAGSARVQSADSDFEAFKEAAKAWRALGSKPQLPDECDKYRVLAENAAREKKFGDAVDFFEKGLHVEPLWPAGQFNAAMIYGQLEDYSSAAHHMNRYLELVPDAPDAKACRERLIIWEYKAKGNQ
jgi:tetratricopeptide (TPR) repeat protein